MRSSTAALFGWTLVVLLGLASNAQAQPDAAVYVPGKKATGGSGHAPWKRLGGLVAFRIGERAVIDVDPSRTRIAYADGGKFKPGDKFIVEASAAPFEFHYDPMLRGYALFGGKSDDWQEARILVTPASDANGKVPSGVVRVAGEEFELTERYCPRRPPEPILHGIPCLPDDAFSFSLAHHAVMNGWDLDYVRSFPMAARINGIMTGSLRVWKGGQLQ